MVIIKNISFLMKRFSYSHKSTDYIFISYSISNYETPLLSESLPTLLGYSLWCFSIITLSIVVERSSHREASLRRLSLFSTFLPYLGVLVLATIISL